jgi:hypothetical protein
VRIRVALGLTVVTATVLFLVVPAWGCLGEDLTTSPSAGPGDPVSFSISGIQPGAHYSVTFEGRGVASGTNTSSNNGVSGSFSMPDLGSSPRTVYAYADTVHPDDGDSFHLSSAIEYQPPAAPSSGGSSGASSGASSGSSSGASSTSDSTSATGSAGHDSKQPHPSRNQNAPASSHHQANMNPSAKSETAATPGTVAAAHQPQVSASDSAAPSKEKERSSGAGSSVPDRVLGKLGSTTSVGPANVPTIGLLAIAVIFLVGAVLAAIVIYLFRSGPDSEAAKNSPVPPGPDPAEAELQEMIADEMARQLLDDLDLSEPAKVSSK